jgi:catechol 2,3-dioxygenase-like lactoylglutathione lyase family enzyme
MSILFAGMPVTDIGSAREWYERLLGRPPDMVPHDREVVWQLAGAGWVYVVENPERAGKSLLTLLVEDLDAEVASVAERGLSPDARMEGPPRKAEFLDPDGNKVTFGQPGPRAER